MRAGWTLSQQAAWLISTGRNAKARRSPQTSESFTPVDRDEPITFVNKREKAAAPVEKAVVKRKTTDQKVKATMSADAEADLPFNSRGSPRLVSFFARRGFYLAAH